MRTSLFKTGAALLLGAVAFSFQASAQVDFTRIVWLGDSEGAGFSNNCLAKHVQLDSMGAILARQAASDFQQPIVEEPGLGGCLVLASLAPSFTAKPSTGVPSNLTLARPYNNLSVGGCSISDFVHATTKSDASPGTCASTIDLVLRNSALKLGSMVDQAVALSPTFVVVEDVGNNYLGAVLSGTVIDGVTVAPTAKVAADYKAALDKLKAKQQNGVIFTNVDISDIPFDTTIPPVLTSGGAPVINPATGQPIFLLGPRDPSDPTKPCPGGAPACPVPPGTLVTLLAAPFLSQGYGIPCAVAPNLAKCNNPLPDSGNPTTGTPGVLLYPNEVSLLRARHDEYNAAIRTAAAAAGYKVFDADSLLTELRLGVDIGGLTVSSAFLTGGAVSYDGFHLTSIGYAIVADELIKFINANFVSNLPEPDLSTFLFQGNTTGVMAPPLPFLSQEEVVETAARIFTPELQLQLMNFIPPRRAPQLTIGNSEPVVPGAPVVDLPEVQSGN